MKQTGKTIQIYLPDGNPRSLKIAEIFIKPEFLDLAKLTLGAFIGSFVQKGKDAPNLPVVKSSE